MTRDRAIAVPLVESDGTLTEFGALLYGIAHSWGNGGAEDAAAAGWLLAHQAVRWVRAVYAAESGS